jgi:hypothetical protein
MPSKDLRKGSSGAAVMSVFYYKNAKKRKTNRLILPLIIRIKKNQNI